MSPSLGGVVTARDGSLDWIAMADELRAHVDERARAHGSFLDGRPLYELITGQ